jgi:WD40 repeat protein
MARSSAGNLRIALFLAMIMVAVAAGLPAQQPSPTEAQRKPGPDPTARAANPIREEKKQPRLDRFGDPLPADAVARLGTVRFRHGGGVACVSYSPDGKLLASSGHDNLIRIWEADTGRELHRCVCHTHSPGSIVFSPNGKTLVSKGQCDIRFWSVATGKEVQQEASAKVVHRTRQGGVPEEGNWSINCIAFSPDGSKLASGGDDCAVRLWDPATGQELGTLQSGGERISSVAFSPDGKHLAAGGRDRPISLWEVATGKELRRYGEEKSDVHVVLFSPDGKDLLTAGSGGTIHLWDMATGSEVRQFEGHEGFTECLAVSRDGKTLFSGGFEKTIRVWDLATGKEVRVLGKHRDLVHSIALSPHGKVLASTGLRENLVRLWNVGTGKEICHARGHECDVVSVGLCADGKAAASVADNGNIRTWDAVAGEELHHIDHGAGWARAALSSDLRMAAVSDYLNSEDMVRLWDVVEGRELPSPKMGKALVGTPAFSPSSQILAVPVAGGVCLSEVRTAKPLRNLEGLEEGYCGPCAQFYLPAFSPDGTLLAVSDGGAIHVFDVASGKEVRQVSNPETSTRPSVAFSPDGKTLAAWHSDHDRSKCVLILWEVATGNERARVTEEECLCFPGRDMLALSPDGRTLATTGPDNSVRLWEVATGCQRFSLRGHCGPVTALGFSADSKRLASGSADTSILIWDVTGVLTDRPGAPGALSRQELDALWPDLCSGDAARAYRAQAKLIAAPKETLALLKEHLYPDLKGVPQLVADLDADDFTVRQKAAEELEKRGAAAEPALRKALKVQPSIELKRRIERLLERLRLQALRAMEVVEHLDTPESRQLVEKLAAGPGDDCLTTEAKAITRRFASRDKKSP